MRSKAKPCAGKEVDEVLLHTPLQLWGEASGRHGGGEVYKVGAATFALRALLQRQIVALNLHIVERIFRGLNRENYARSLVD